MEENKNEQILNQANFQEQKVDTTLPMENMGDYEAMMGESPAVPARTQLDNELDKLKRQADAMKNVDRKAMVMPGRFAISRGSAYHTIDGGATGYIDPEEEERKKWEMKLYHSYATNQILTATCLGIQQKADPNAPDGIHVYAKYGFGPYVVYIGIEDYIDLDMVELNAHQHARGNASITVAETAVRFLQHRMSAETDMVITKLPKNPDGSTSFEVYGSRLLATRMNRIRFWYGKTVDDEYLMKVGDKAEARIVSTSKSGIRVEVFGVETFIDYHELSWIAINDARTKYFAGDRVLVRLLTIERNPEKDYAVSFTASVKRATTDPRDRGLQQFTPAAQYRGTVAYIKTNGDRPPLVFVNLAEGVQCACDWPRGPVVPVVGCEVRVYITHQRPEEKWLYGRILYVKPLN